MTDVSLMVWCTECRVLWPLDAETPTCVAPDHHHQHHELHRHRTVVTLPDGTAIIAVSFDGADPYTRDQVPDLGLYLDRCWPPPWSHGHVSWPDFGVPEDCAGVVAALQDLLVRARSGTRVEIGCLGGHGRTGTALACLAALSGLPAGDAVAWVRANYCARAVETDEQAALVATLPA